MHGWTNERNILYMNSKYLYKKISSPLNAYNAAEKLLVFTLKITMFSCFSGNFFSICYVDVAPTSSRGW